MFPIFLRLIPDITETAVGIQAVLSNGQLITSTHTGSLNLSFMPMSARKVYIFHDDKLQASLLSIGIFTDAGFVVIYTKHHVTVFCPKTKTHLLTGVRDNASKMWKISFLQSNSASVKAANIMNNVLALPRHADRSDFYNRCFGSCANSTFLSAL
jgi:hypothetical protein